MSENSTIGFVDANVLADAILVENRLEEIAVEVNEHKDIERAKKDIQAIFKRYIPAKPAYQLFFHLRIPMRPRTIVITSNLASLEARGVITEQYTIRQMERRKIPRSKVRLSDEDLRQIHVGIFLFKKKIGHAMIQVRDDYDFSLAESLVTDYGCGARDSILIATAIKNSCKTFITRDSRLKRNLRVFKAIRIRKVQSVLDELGVSTFEPPIRRILLAKRH